VEYETFCNTKIYKYVSDSIFQVKSLLPILFYVALKQVFKILKKSNKKGKEHDFKLYRNPII